MRLTKHIFNSISRHAKTCLPSLPLGLLTRAFPRPSRTMVAAFDPKTTGVLAEFWNELVSSDRSQTSPSTEQISAVRARLISVGGSNLNDRQICGWFERPDLGFRAHVPLCPFRALQRYMPSLWGRAHVPTSPDLPFSTMGTSAAAGSVLPRRTCGSPIAHFKRSCSPTGLSCGTRA